MRSVEPGEGPSPDEFFRRLTGQLAALRGAPPYVVAELTTPSFERAFLAETASSNGEFFQITLRYEEGAASARRATVTSRVALGSVSDSLPLQAEVLQERDDYFAQFGVDEPGPAEDSEVRSSTVSWKGASVTIDLLDCGTVWAARFQDDASASVVTVVARGIPIGDISLDEVRNLDRYVDAYEQRISAASAPSDEPGPARAVPAGSGALHALLKFTVESTIASQTRRSNPTAPRFAGDGTWRHSLWIAAVDHQITAWEVSRQQADAQVETVVNHFSHLAQDAQWVALEPELRARAIAEATEYVSDGADVPSKLAHQAWLTYWNTKADRAGGDPRAPIVVIGPGEDAPRRDWLAAWDRWLP